MPARTHSPTPLAASIGLIALVGLLAACAGTFGPPAFPAPTTSPSVPATAPSASAPGAPSSGAVASDSPSDSPEPSVDAHGVPDLEALLPAKVGNVVLERLSLSGHDFYSTGTAETQGRLDDMLSKLGKTVSDLTVADAGDPTGIAVLEVGAFRVAGADSAQLLSEWVASNQAASPGRIQVSNVTVDGRALTKLLDTGRPVGGTIHAFVKGDVIFLVDADDPTLLSSALAQLPKP